MLRVVDLVYDEDDRLAHTTQLLGQIRIEEGETILPIDDKEQHLAGRDRDIHLGADLGGEIGIEVRANAAGVENGKRRITEAAFRWNAIAGDTGLIVHDRDLLPGKTIEEGGLSDVGTSDDGDSARHERWSLANTTGLASDLCWSDHISSGRRASPWPVVCIC